MITEYMRLNSRADARLWASQIVNYEEEIQSLTQWIWRNKPEIGCTYAEHPISGLDDEEFWNILDE